MTRARSAGPHRADRMSVWRGRSGAALGGAAIAALLLLWARLRRSFVLVTVRGQSMEPSYPDGGRLLVRKGASCRPGDVAVFRGPQRPSATGPAWLVKRVAGVAGEPVPDDLREMITDHVIPDGCIVVRGDAARSLGSRQLGYISDRSVLGVVVHPVQVYDFARPRLD